LTGKKVMETYGIDAEELGDECYKGKLQAYQKGKEVVEETMVEKIPRYVPKDTSPRDHAQRGVNVTWSFNWGDEGIAPSARAYNSGDELHYAFDIYRRKDDSIIPLREYARLFPFRFEDYKKVYIKREHSECYEIYYPVSEDSELYVRIEKAYEQDISKMKFNPADVLDCFDSDNEEKIVTPTKEAVPAKTPTTPATLPQGGSRPESTKITATTEACKLIISAIQQDNHLDAQGKIGRKEFVDLVQDSMKAQDGENFQVTAARNMFATSPELEQFKRQRGRRKNQ